MASRKYAVVWFKEKPFHGYSMSITGVERIEDILCKELPGFLHLPSPISQKPSLINSSEIALIEFQEYDDALRTE